MDNLLFKSNNRTLIPNNESECNGADLNFPTTKLGLTAATKEIPNLTSLMPAVDLLMPTASTQFGRAMPFLNSPEKLNHKSLNQVGSCNSTLLQCTNFKFSMQKSDAAFKFAHSPSAAAAAAAPPQKRPPHTPKPSECPEVRNVIASTNLGCKLDLRYIAMHAKNVEYNPKLRDVLLMRIRRPFCLAFIYSSGKLICTGTKSCQAARLAARKFARVIQKLGLPIRFARSRIDNIIASCKLNCKIRLEALELFRHRQCVYEPELFPSLVYRLPRLGSQVFAFSSGTLVLCNIRKMSKVQETFSEFYAIVQPFKKMKSIAT